LTVFLPLGLGIAALGQFFSRYHGPIFIVGSILLISLGIMLITGMHMKLPFKVTPRLRKHNAISVYLLGIFSGIATTCCAPVLAGVLALAVLPGSIFWGGIYTLSYVLGMAAVIVTDDGYAVFGRRAKQRVSVNTGINLATSGGFRYDRDKLESLGFSRFVETEILREAKEEVALNGNDCAVTILAIVRELSRAGSPEILALIEFYGKLSELVRRMESNHHPEQDVDAIFALPLSEARALVREPDAGKVLQPKALVNLIMLDRYLRNGLA